MAAKKASKEKDLDALLQEATSLLGEKEISRKRKKDLNDLEFYRDSTTGLRKYKYEYRPREKKVTNTSLCSATEEGDFTIFYQFVVVSFLLTVYQVT